MGERLLLALRKIGTDALMWLYSHWDGDRMSFMMTVADILVEMHRENKKRFEDLLMLLLKKGFIVENEHSDRNYLAYISYAPAAGHMEILWVPLRYPEDADITRMLLWEQNVLTAFIGGVKTYVSPIAVAGSIKGNPLVDPKPIMRTWQLNFNEPTSVAEFVKETRDLLEEIVRLGKRDRTVYEVYRSYYEALEKKIREYNEFLTEVITKSI